jgi:lysophospholipase L1-like esterase
MKRITWSQAMALSRRQFLKTAVAATALAVAGLAAHPALFADEGKGNEHWVATWTTAQVAQVPSATNHIADQTLRQIVHVSVGGSDVRVRLANTYGTAPLDIAAAHIALRDTGAAIVPGSGRTLTFGGSPSIRMVPGATVVSDGVDLQIPPLSDVAIDLYLPGDTLVSGSPHTFHSGGRQTNYFTTGNLVSAPDLPGAATRTSWYFVKGVEVLASTQTGAIVALGDSITDGTASTNDTNNRWPDHLARRIMAVPGNHKMGVLNVGIAGNRVLTDALPPSTAGVNAQSRFDRDVLAQTGVTHVIVLEGINDSSRTVFQADQIIAGHKQFIERAHAAGLTIYGATLTPAGSTAINDPLGIREANRTTVNEWIRTSGAYDAVIDFDEVTRDPSNPTFFLPIYDSGDHLHPGNVGYEAMGNAIDLKLFKNGEGH